MAFKQLQIAALLSLIYFQAEGKLVTFSNKEPRRDDTGNTINAHDGTTQRFSPGGLFYYHAMGYPSTNETGAINGCSNGGIYKRTNSLRVYSSPDLSSGSWHLNEIVYPGASNFPTCTYFRSQAAFNRHTMEYVLWANAVGCVTSTCPNGTCAAYAVGVSKNPQGPFKFVGMTQPNASSLPPKNGFIGDFALFADSDGTGYIILTHGIAGAGHRDMFIFRLSADFYSIESSSGVGPLPGQHLVEAPSFFRRGDTYYALLGGCTCMGLYGGGVGVLTAKHPLGPWTNVTGSLDPGCDMWKQTTCFEVGPGQVCNPVTQAQQNYVMQVPLANGSTAYIWTGDKWQQSPNGKFDEQPQTWLPLEFDGDTILPLKYVDSFTLDVAE
eukprot:m.343814 g.343814  ORF g.343814 m.343814 type:complete len:382 (-) comp23381_c0_seq1:31-1176(-)